MIEAETARELAQSFLEEFPLLLSRWINFIDLDVTPEKILDHNPNPNHHDNLPNYRNLADLISCLTPVYLEYLCACEAGVDLSENVYLGSSAQDKEIIEAALYWCDIPGVADAFRLYLAELEKLAS